MFEGVKKGKDGNTLMRVCVWIPFFYKEKKKKKSLCLDEMFEISTHTHTHTQTNKQKKEEGKDKQGAKDSFFLFFAKGAKDSRDMKES